MFKLISLKFTVRAIVTARKWQIS